MGYRVINGQLYPIENLNPSSSSKEASKSNIKQKKSFEDILKSQIAKEKDNSFTISNHAAERLDGISFNQNDMNIINEGINKASEKGSKNCLILYKDVALVTSIENRTIITAVDKTRNRENIFTNIDSVVLL